MNFSQISLMVLKMNYYLTKMILFLTLNVTQLHNKVTLFRFHFALKNDE